MSKTAALIGNPNCGKTTLFNALTGSRQYVGNWSGVTVDKKSGIVLKTDILMTDLPGIYSLSPYSAEEKVTRDFLLNEPPDIIINIIDGTNFQRNFYLSLQLLSLDIPMIIAVNMMDEVKKQGIDIDFDYVEKLLNIKIIPISAKKGENIDLIVDEIKKKHTTKDAPREVQYDYKTHKALNDISEIIRTDKKIPYRFYSWSILEGIDSTYLNLSEYQKKKIEEIRNTYKKSSDFQDIEVQLINARYSYIEELSRKVISSKKSSTKKSVSDKIDLILTHKILSIPIFLCIMSIIFILTFGSFGAFFEDKIAFLIYEIFIPFVSKKLSVLQCSKPIIELTCGGVIGGVGGILKFFPRIAILFLCLSVLEDSGYMARAAFISDRFLKKIGLSGKSFIPILMGLGCTTTAVMSARTQENSSVQKATILLLPFISCSAKLTIYSFFVTIFFPECAGLVVISLYLIGISLLILTGLIFKKFGFNSQESGFIMELPPYRIPQLKSVLKNTWEKTKGFIVKAGTVIFIMSIVVWLLQNFTFSLDYVSDASQSAFGKIGAFLAPFFAPLGFSEWKSVVSLLSGLIAKEGVVSSISILYSNSSLDLESAIKNTFTPLSAYSYMVFCLLYPPCISAYSAMKKELKSFMLTLFSIILQFLTAYSVAFIIYQTGKIVINLMITLR